MHVKTYPDASAFLVDAQGYLEREEEKNTIMLGILMRHKAKSTPSDAAPWFATVCDGSLIALAAAMAPPRPLVLACGFDQCESAVETLAESLAKSGVHLKGAIGRCPVAAAFASTWTTLAGVAARSYMKEREYALRQVLHAGSASGYLKPAEAEDFDLVLDWAVRFRADAHLHQNVPAVEAEIQDKISQGDVCLWMDNGSPVAMAGVNIYTRRGARIGLVYTPPELRGHGYATACVAHLSQRLLNAGREFCTLSTDLGNPISNHVYQKIGYQPLFDFDQYEFQAPSA